MASMFQTVKNAWKIPDLRRKLLITIGLLLIFRLGSFVPVPTLDKAAFQQLIQNSSSIFGFLDILGGGAFQQATIFAMSITPYINSSIIMQLLTIAIPALERMQKEGEEGRKRIAQITRYGTVVLAFIQATALYVSMIGPAVKGGSTVLSFFIVTMSFTAGTAFLMWLGEQITEFGIGNGISLLIFAGIISRAPRGIGSVVTLFISGGLGEGILGFLMLIGVAVIFLGLITSIVFVQQAERRIPVQYAKRVVGRKMYGGHNTHLPIKVNLAGVIPIIFAMSILIFPASIVGFFFPHASGSFVEFIKNFHTTVWYAVVNALLVIFFTFFYTMVYFNPVEVANNLKKNGGFIPGIRPGKPTSDYIASVLNKVTWFGALFLAAVTILPSVLQLFTKINNVWFGGTAALILVGVALDVIKQIESQMLMRHYKGFLE
jgi:preprotein translocase subunit SecY